MSLHVTIRKKNVRYLVENEMFDLNFTCIVGVVCSSLCTQTWDAHT